MCKPQYWCGRHIWRWSPPKNVKVFFIFFFKLTELKQKGTNYAVYTRQLSLMFGKWLHNAMCLQTITAVLKQ